MSRQCWLINARSGGGEGGRLAAEAKRHVDVVPLEYQRLEEQLRALSGYDRLAIVGGDGTFSSILTAAALPDVPVALVPIGTANDLARDLGTFRIFRGAAVGQMVERIDALREGRLATWDCVGDGQVQPFCNYVSLGFEGAIVADFDAWRTGSQIRNRLVNRFMYVRFGLRHLGLRLRNISVGVDAGTLTQVPSTRGLLFSNVRSHMGCGYATRESEPSDDTIECAIVSSVIDYARMVGSAWGVLPNLRSFQRGSGLTVHGIPNGTAMQVDGEARPAVTGGEMTIRFRRFARVLVP